jgi:hypothetical protein
VFVIRKIINSLPLRRKIARQFSSSAYVRIKIEPLYNPISFCRLTKIYPALGNSTSSEGIFVPAITPSAQATNQLVATVVTVIFAIIGGSITGLIMKLIGRFQRLDETYRHGATVVKLALAVGNISGGGIGLNHMMPQEAFFDDNLFFEVNEVIIMFILIMTKQSHIFLISG